MLRKTAAEMVAEARAKIIEIDAMSLLEEGSLDNRVLVDIRDIRERQRSGFIPGSVHAPRGMLEFWIDPASPYHKPVFAQDDKEYVFYCASGWRSALATASLQEMGFKAAHITGGFSSWVEAGGPVDEMSQK